MIALYEDRVRACQSRIRAIRRLLNQVVFFRFLFFSALLLSGWLLLSGFSSTLFIGAILSAVGFIAGVRFYFHLKDKLAFWKKMCEVNVNELDILQNKPNVFPDGGNFLDSETYLDDLDIFGRASLFHLLNRTTTSHGAQLLASRLRNSLRSPTDIQDMQEAVRALSAQTEVRQRLLVRGLLAGEKEGNLHRLEAWLSSPSRLHGRIWVRWLRWVLICYNIFGLFLWASKGQYSFLLVGVLASWIYLSVFMRYINAQHLLISRKQAILSQYADILAVFSKVDPKGSILLRQLKERTSQAHRAIRQLAGLAAFFDQRLNAFVNIFLNSLFLYDLFCIMQLEGWKKRHAPSFSEWVSSVGTIEFLDSLATFAFNNPDHTYPSPAAVPHPFIEATGMAHPLIPASERVTNDIRIGHQDRLILVTGSNMSGKTTFLRTIGVNLLLAQCGAPVCASSFTFTPLEILSSLRISDSLQDHTSYFMAELKKLRKIIRSLEEGGAALVLVDEILRGTNSEDKTYGSEQFIRKLVAHPCLAFFATHDLSLGRLEQELPGLVSNYCFESTIEGDEILFPYKLERGIARNRNASFLMRKMDII